MKGQNNEVMKNQATKSINFSMLNLIPKAYPQSLISFELCSGMTNMEPKNK